MKLAPEENVKKCKKTRGSKKKWKENVAVSAGTMYPKRGGKCLQPFNLKGRKHPTKINEFSANLTDNLLKMLERLFQLERKVPKWLHSGMKLVHPWSSRFQMRQLDLEYFGNVFLAEYQGVQTVVKQIKEKEWS